MTLAVMEEPTPLVARQGPIDRPAAMTDGWIPLSAVTREALKPVHDSPWGPLFVWKTAERPQPWQVWRTMVDDAPPSPLAPCQVACPAGTDAGRYVGLVAAGRYDEAYAVAAEVNPFPSVCGWICTAPCEAACRRGRPRRADRDPDAEAIRGRARDSSPRCRRPRGPAHGARRDRRRRTGRDVGRLLPGPARLRRDRHRGDARPRRHDGDRHSRVPAAARRPPGGDQADRRPRRGAPPRHRDGPRLHPRRPRARGLQGGLPRDGRLEEPPRSAFPATTPARSSPRRASSRRSTSARTRASAARSSWWAAAAPRWTPPDPRSGAAPRP